MNLVNCSYDLSYFDLVNLEECFLNNLEPLVIRSAVPSNICSNIIEQNKLTKRQLSVHPIIGKSRTELDVFYRNTSFIKTPYLDNVLEYFHPSKIANKINEHWITNFNYDFLNNESPVYTVFSTGEYCNSHVDVTIKDGDLCFASKEGRRLTAICYLNSWSAGEEPGTFSGGELIFSSIKDDYDNFYTYRPNIGDILIFPSTPYYVHNVPRVTRGSRHTLLQWIELI